MNRFWCCSRHFCCGWRVSKIISTVPMSFRNSHWESTTTLSAIALNCWNILSRYLRRNAFSSGTEIAHGPVPLSSLCSGVSSLQLREAAGAPVYLRPPTAHHQHIAFLSGCAPLAFVFPDLATRQLGSGWPILGRIHSVGLHIKPLGTSAAKLVWGCGPPSYSVFTTKANQRQRTVRERVACKLIELMK